MKKDSIKDLFLGIGVSVVAFYLFVFITAWL